MTDTKLRPEDLNAEERAIVEDTVTEYCPYISTEAWLETYEWALQRIEARRVLFAVAPEKVNTRCTYVGGLFSEEQRCIRESGHDGSHIYLNEKPAPEKAAKVETMADRIAADLKAGTFRGEQPAPPEPAAPSWMKVSCMGDVDAGKEDLLCPPPDPKSCWVCRQHEEHCCPEPEPATPVAYTCPNCNRPTKSPNGHAISGATVFSPAEFTCKPAQPEPAAPVLYVCPSCNKQTATKEEHVSSRNRDSFTCQPAPPESAATVNGSTPVGEYDPDMKPAAREMPEAVRDAVDTLRSGVPSYPTWRQYADTLESWWRNLAQPVAVGMTEELKRVLDFAAVSHKDANADTRVLWDPEYLVAVGKAIAAVRQQAAQGRKVELGKVRELVNDLKRALSEAAPSEMTMLDPHEWRSDLDAVFAELDAAEGKVAG